MASEHNGSGAQDGASQGCVPGTAGQTPVQGVMQLQPGLQYGAPGPSGMYPPAGQYISMPQQQQNEQLRLFWLQQHQEIQQVGTDPAEFKNHQLPLARIKKIMKSDEDVRMISAEAPVLFAKACEMFILELTLRSWNHSEENKRRTLQRNDIAAAITRTDIFDFLVDIVPREERCDDGPRPMPQQLAGVGMPGMPGGAPMGYWQPQQQGQGQPQQGQAHMGGQMGQVGSGASQGGPGSEQQQQQHMGVAGVGQPQGAMNPTMIQAYYSIQNAAQQQAAMQQQQQAQQHAAQQQQQQQQQAQQMMQSGQ